MAMVLVQVKELLHLAIALRMLNQAEDLPNPLFSKELHKAGFHALLLDELCAVIADALLDGAILEGTLHALNGGVSCCAFDFEQGKQIPACIIQDGKRPLLFVGVKMPVNMHSSQAVPPLISYPILLPHIFLCFLLSKTKQEHYLVNPVMADMLAIIPLNEPL